MKLRAVFCLSAVAFVLVACASARSSLDSDSDERVSLPPPRYSAEAVGAMFERPTTAAQLLKNLKLAVDKDLIAEPGFFTDANLLKFFGCDGIRRAPRDRSINQFALQDAFLTNCDEHLPAMTVHIEQGLTRTGAFVPAAGHVGHFQGPIRRFGYINMDVEEVPEISVGAIRAVFGTETELQTGGSWATNGGPNPDTSKGDLFYGTSAAAFGKGHGEQLKFVVKRARYDDLSMTKRDRNVYDMDAIAGIFIYVPEPRRAEPSLTDRMSQYERPARTIELHQVVGSSDVSQGVRACGGQ